MKFGCLEKSTKQQAILLLFLHIWHQGRSQKKNLHFTEFNYESKQNGCDLIYLRCWQWCREIL